MEAEQVALEPAPTLHVAVAESGLTHWPHCWPHDSMVVPTTAVVSENSKGPFVTQWLGE